MACGQSDCCYARGCCGYHRPTPPTLPPCRQAPADAGPGQDQRARSKPAAVESLPSGGAAPVAARCLGWGAAGGGGPRRPRGLHQPGRPHRSRYQPVPRGCRRGGKVPRAGRPRRRGGDGDPRRDRGTPCPPGPRLGPGPDSHQRSGGRRRWSGAWEPPGGCPPLRRRRAGRGGGHPVAGRPGRLGGGVRPGPRRHPLHAGPDRQPAPAGGRPGGEGRERRRPVGLGPAAPDRPGAGIGRRSR